MSRVGKHAIPVPSGVNIAHSGDSFEVSGKLGKLTNTIPELVVVEHKDSAITVKPVNESAKPVNESAKVRSLWGTVQRNLSNAVKGVSEGFVYRMDLVGVGYRASVQGKNLVLQLGFSHDVVYPLPEGVEAKCEKPTTISLTGANKQVLGQIVSEIQSNRPPEPYKGKGVIKCIQKGNEFVHQFVLRKEGKKK